jgi:GMP synthase-like glutamine amidotransferase
VGSKSNIVGAATLCTGLVTVEEDYMIWYVDIEHPNALTDAIRAPDFAMVRNQRAQICAEAAGAPCEPVLYQQVSWELAHQRHIQAIAISGNTTEWVDYDFKTFEPLKQLIQSGQFVVIGFCGGHQLIGLLYDAPCDAIRMLNPGEADPGGFAHGWFKEVGFMPVHVVKPDPIFDGLGADPVLFESHYWEIKELPKGFDLLASTENVRIQAIRHQQHLIYGTQFHPEVSSDDCQDGFVLLQNFFRLAGLRKD